MFANMVTLARRIALFIQSSEDYDWLPNAAASIEDTHIIVLFRAKSEDINNDLARRINESRRMYVSGTIWQGQRACRIAVASWRVDIEKDFAIVKDILTSIARNR